MSAFPASWKYSCEHRISNCRESWDEEHAGNWKESDQRSKRQQKYGTSSDPFSYFFSWKLPLWCLFPLPPLSPYVGRSAGAEGFARISQCLVCSRKACAEVWGAVGCSFGKQEEGERNRKKEVNLLVCSTSVLVRQRALYQSQGSLTLVWFLR